MAMELLASARKTLGVTGRKAARKREHAGRTLLLVFIISVVMCAFFLKSWINHQSVGVGYDIGQLKQEIRTLKEEHQKMTVEMANLSSVNRIERIATEKLKMKVPDPDQIIKIQEK
jgi:cell division protein FtsL